MCIIHLEGANEAGIIEDLPNGMVTICIPGMLDLNSLVLYRFDERGRVWPQKIYNYTVTCFVEQGDALCLFDKSNGLRKPDKDQIASVELLG